MARQRFAALMVALLGLAALAGPSLFAQQQSSPPIRLLVKLRSTLAQDVELALPMAQMSLTPGQTQTASIETFLSMHQVRRMRPLYPELVRLKKQGNLSDAQVAAVIRQRFVRRARRFRGTFAPPEISRTYVIELDSALQGDLPQMLTELRADPGVEYAEEEHLFTGNETTNDPYLTSSGTWGQSYGDLWGINEIGAPTAWNTTTGTGEIVAVVDTGIDYNHPDIASNVWVNTKEIAGNGVDDDQNGYVDDVRGWNFIGASYLTPQQSNNPIDHNGHGTHVAGTIAAVGNNGIGVIGMAWNAQVMAVKALDDTGTGIDSTLGPAIFYAANNGADVINCSWGATSYSQTISDAISYAYSLGAVIVAAAGNNSQDAMNFFPAASPYVITVAASDPNNNLASFSNFGSKIDVAAPGVDILSLQAAGTALGPVVSPGYIRLSGTSMATPHVSGMAALVLAANVGYSNEDARQAIRVAATDLGTPGFDATFGYGGANAATAVSENGVLEARILSPTNEANTEGLLIISGVARGAGFSHYTLDYGAGTLPTTWTTFATSSTAVSGTLGEIDTSVLTNGVYQIRLTVYIAAGDAFVDRVQINAYDVFISSPVPPTTPTGPTTFKNGAVIPISGTALAANFENFQVAWAAGLDAATGWQTTGITLTGGGTSQTANGLLANWDTSSVVNAGYYTIRLTVTSAGLSTQALTMVYLEPQLMSANWPQFFSQGPYFSAGVVPALNADGTLRLLMQSPGQGGAFGQLWTMTPSGPPQRQLLTGYGSFQQPSVANLDGNPGDEAVTADSTGIAVFGNSSMYPLPTSPTLDYQRSQTVIDNLAGDTQYDVLALGSNYNTQLAYVSAWNASGSLINGNFPIQIPDQNPVKTSDNRTRLVTGDINGDGKDEIVVIEGLSSTTFTLGLFANDGTPKTWSVPTLTGTPEAMAAADFDNNGKLETVVVCYSGAQAIVHVFQPDGTERNGWPLTLPNPNTSSQSFLAIGDLSRNGSKEIVYSHETYLYVLQANGTMFPGAWPLQTTAPGYASVAIGDVNGDGYPEIVTTIDTLKAPTDPFFVPAGQYYDEKLLAIRRDGSIANTWQLTGSNGYNLNEYPAPAIGDFNQDGITDIAVAYEVAGPGAQFPGVVTVLSTGAKFNAALNDWPLIHQNARNTNVLPSTVVGATATAVFVGSDAATQGTWQGKYGAGGYSLANSTQSLPSYDPTFAPQGQLNWTWSGATTDVRALQLPGTNSRIAAAWYSTTSFSMDVNISSGTQQVALYLVDWDSTTRAETINIVDANNPAAVLASTTATAFHGGVYLVYNISGHVKINVTTLSGVNAVASGVFFDGAGSYTPPLPALSVTKTHTGNFTQGQQNATYTVTVSNGVAAGASVGTVSVIDTLPAGLTLVSMSGTGWNCTANACSRNDSIGAGASFSPITVTVNVAAGAGSPLVNQVSVSGGGSTAASASDATTITTVASAGSSAQFLRLDATTQGNWQGQYGGDGYQLANSPGNLPSYDTSFAAQNSAVWMWASSTSDPRGLQTPGGSGRFAATWYSTTAFSFDVNFTDGNSHQVALYALDWDQGERVETVQVVDAVTSAPLASQSIVNFSNGVYLVWTISGHVKINVTNTGGPNAVISGVFFGPAASSSPAAPSLSITKTHGGHVMQGQQGLNYNVTVSNAANAGPTSGTVTVNESLPSGLTLVSMAGNGWACANTSCSRSDALAAGTNYPGITVTVNVASNASSPQLNEVTVSGGGSPSANGTDSTVIEVPGISASATFIRQDLSTKGAWQGVYGIDGYVLANSVQNSPWYDSSFAVQNQQNWTWAASSSDPRALSVPNSSSGIAAAWYSFQNFDCDLYLFDNQPHYIALYAVDWDRQGRTESVDIVDAISNAELDHESISNFGNGAYLVWQVTGHVKVIVTPQAGPNAVVSGIFFGASQ